MESGSAAKPEAKVSSLFIYPIKSCRGISVSQAPLTPYGLRWDRKWMVVNHKGRGCTQRVEPKLALVEVELPNEALLEDSVPTNDSYLVIKAPGMAALRVPLSKPCEIAHGVSVWEWSGSALDEGNEAAKWFSDYIGKPSRLVRFNDESETRPVDPEFGRGHNVVFSDGYPFMILSQGSMDEINEALEVPVPVNRFRPNILVEGCEPFSEDLWTEFRINNSTFEGVKLCDRCKIPTINQENGISSPEPNVTLMKIRSGEVLRPASKKQKQIYMGQNLVWKDHLSQDKRKFIKVGDPIHVISKVSSVTEAAA